MDARLKFKEGWIMLKRPFSFAELKRPLQKLTILYAYSERPIVTLKLTDKGKKEFDEANEAYNKSSHTQSVSKWRKYYGEDQEDYDDRFNRQLDNILNDKGIQYEHYEGELVQCYVENEMCRFYPSEYSVISLETFEHILTAEEYDMDIQTKSHFKREDVAKRLHYIRSRGIGKTIAERMSSAGAKDAVLFRPKIELLEYFCREYEIYREDDAGNWHISPRERVPNSKFIKEE